MLRDGISLKFLSAQAGGSLHYLLHPPAAALSDVTQSNYTKVIWSREDPAAYSSIGLWTLLLSFL